MKKFFKNYFKNNFRDKDSWESREKDIRTVSILFLITIVVTIALIVIILYDHYKWETGLVTIISIVLTPLSPAATVLMSIIKYKNNLDKSNEQKKDIKQ